MQRARRCDATQAITPGVQRLEAVEVRDLWLLAGKHSLRLVLDHRQDEGVLVLEVVVEL